MGIKKTVTQIAFGKAWEAADGNLVRMGEENKCDARNAFFLGTEKAELYFKDEASYLVFLIKWA